MDLNKSSTKKSPKIILNKSASFSGSPIAQKYEIKQLFRNKDGDTLLHQYSYEITGRRKPNYQHVQQFCKYTKPAVFKSKPITNSSDYYYTPYEGGIKKEVPDVKFGTPFNHFFNFAKHIAEEKGFVDSLSENVPMEIDISIGSDTSFLDKSLKSDADKSMTDVHQNDKEKIEHKSKVPKLSVKPTKSIEVIKNMRVKSQSKILFRMLKILFSFFVPIICGLFIMYCKSDSGFIETLDSEPIIKELHNLLYGQDDVINKLEYNFNLIKNNKIFVFTGGVGVGKTYTAKLIVHKYPWKNNIQNIIFNSKDQYGSLEKEITNNLVGNSNNLIIMDGLVMDDIYFVLPIINNLSVSGTRFILIIIFNIQDNSIDSIPKYTIKSKSKEISKIFNDNNIGHTVFMFENLNEEDTKECIRYAMLQRGIKIDEKNVDSVLESINYKFSGCKGVYRKVSLLDASSNVIKNVS